MSDDQKKIIFSMVNVGKKYGTKYILKNISLSYFYGAKIGILGLNGAGKSTLLNIMSGTDQHYLGETHLSQGYTVGYLPQEPALNEDATVKETVCEGVSHIQTLLREFDEINAQFEQDMTPEELEKLMEQQAKVQDKLDKMDAWTLDDKLNYAMEALACPDANKKIKVLSGGEKRRVALCRILIQKPDILLLDEPTNHLDARSIAWLEQHLQNYKGTVIAVTHDRYFLDNVAGWILELDRGEGYPFKGNYSSWLKQKQTRLEQESKHNAQKYKTLKRELEWINMTPKARQAKSKARINSYEKMLNQRQDEIAKDLKIYIPPGPRLGDIVINAEEISKSYGEQKIFHKLSFTLPPGGIVGIVGPNGVGKTTLFKMICDQETIDSGNLKIGQSVKLGYLKQMSDHLDQKKSIFDIISDGNDLIKLGKHEINARTYVAQFNFTGQDQQKLIGQLSGGERNRVKLACLLKEEANLILLDEPSNDLDINTLRALEDALLNFAGCAVVISHDRWFLDRIATHLLVINGNGKCEWFIGNYSEYEEHHKKLKSESNQKRYQNLTRI